jgi:hypothetical protein
MGLAIARASSPVLFTASYREPGFLPNRARRRADFLLDRVPGLALATTTQHRANERVMTFDNV